jgi:multidrug efflux pump subunit AcrB
VRAGQVVVSAVYPGASAQVVTETGTTPLEQQINGPDGGDRRHSALAIGLREG